MKTFKQYLLVFLMLFSLPVFADKEPFSNFRELILSKGQLCPEVSEGEIGQRESYYTVTCKEIHEKVKIYYRYRLEQSQSKGWKVNLVEHYSPVTRATLWGKSE